MFIFTYLVYYACLNNYINFYQNRTYLLK